MRKLKKLFYKIGPVICLLALASCNSLHAHQTNSDVAVRIYVSPQKAQAAVKAWKVTCQSTAAGDCPNEVGQLVIWEDKYVSMCTASLISNDTIIANSHCIDEGKDLKKICAKTSIVFSEQSAAGGEVAECAKIVAKSKIQEGNSDRPDYLIIKLKKPLNRGFFELSREGLADQESLRFFKINPFDKDQDGGELQAMQCTVLHGTFLKSKAIHNDDPVEMIKGCATEAGNSGSPLLNAQNKMAGLFFSTVKHEMAYSDLENDEQKAEFKKALDLNAGYVTNVACIDYSLNGRYTLPKHCHWSATREADPKIEEALAKQSEVDISAHASELDSRFGYEIVTDISDNSLYIYQPACFMKNAKFTAPTSDPTLNLNPATLQWKLISGVDENLKITVRLAPVNVVPAPLSFSLDDLTQVGHADVTNTLETKTWGICH